MDFDEEDPTWDDGAHDEENDSDYDTDFWRDKE